MADRGGLNRRKLYLDLLDEGHGRVWITQTAHTPIAQLWALLMERPARADLPVDHPDFKPGCSADVEEWANARRAKMGLPPVKFV